MAVQGNGITIVTVVDEQMGIRLWMGAGDFRLHWNPDRKKFEVLGRGWLDGRRGRGPWMSQAAWKQAHTIARDHGWKK